MKLWYRYRHELDSHQDIQKLIISLIGSVYAEDGVIFGTVTVALECDGELFLALDIRKGGSNER